MKIFSLIAVLMCLSSVAGFLGKNVKVRGMELRAGEFPTPRAPKLNLVRGLLQGGAALVTGLVVTQNMPQARAQGKYPIQADDNMMATKSHGTSDSPVQQSLKWNCDNSLADRICNFNRHWAENAGYWTSTSYLKDVDRSVVTTYYDSVTGKALFKAPVGRTFDEFLAESQSHGWPSFRDEEVVWDNVRCLKNGEAISTTGTHLGHNLPDRTGNRYCINLVCIAGNPSTA